MNSPCFDLSYDKGSDVLYVSVRRDRATNSVPDRNGMVWRYDVSGNLIGVTIMDFYERWIESQSELANQIACHFDIPTSEAMAVVARGMGGQGDARS